MCSSDLKSFLIGGRHSEPCERTTKALEALEQKNLWWETHMGNTIPEEYRKWGCDAAKMMAEENAIMREKIDWAIGKCHQQDAGFQFKIIAGLEDFLSVRMSKQPIAKEEALQHNTLVETTKKVYAG